MFFARANVVVFLAILCAMPACAEQDDCQRRTVLVSIDTKDGGPVPPLDRTNFEGTYRKKPIRITSTIFNQDPPRVVLLLDISGSMSGMRSGSDRNFSLDLAQDLVSNMPSGVEVGLGFFYKALVPISFPITDRRILNYQIESLRLHPESFRGKTALWAAILKGVKMIDHPHLGDAVYVITDGGDNAGNTTMNRVAKTLRELDVRLFAFVFQHGGGIPSEEETGPAVVLQVAEATGGTIVAQGADRLGIFPVIHDTALVGKSGKLTELGSLLGSQYRQILNFYRVEVDFPEIVDKPREWKLDLVGLSKPQRDNLILKYPHMLVPCH